MTTFERYYISTLKLLLSLTLWFIT